MAMTRTLGRSGIAVSALGMGTWAIGGAMRAGDQPLGYGVANDEEATRAIRRAFDLGVTLFDTANVYGCGHAERVLGAALAKVRDQVVIATKWGMTFDEDTAEVLQNDGTPAQVRPSLEGSLRRLATDHVDVFQFHINEYPASMVEDLVAICEDLIDEGLIRTYGWSTDSVGSAEAFARGPRCSIVQHDLNVFTDNQPMLDLCARLDLASLNRLPLAMGLLSDKITAETRFAADTVRGTAPDWLTMFADGRPVPAFLAKRHAVREILTSGGRTVAQGALAYLWSRSERTIPLPGCRTVAQVEENTKAMAFGPLTNDQVREIRDILAATSG
ncbi:MAG: aldo/keto reductase [Dactylosporangium sp.]|nr:aldo/keto reductase [Dactylosporangium sp.]